MFSCFHGNYDANQSHLMLYFNKEFHTSPYMVMQKRCVWNKTFQFSIKLNFLLHLLICPFAATPRKASNSGHIHCPRLTAIVDNGLSPHLRIS